MSIAAVRNEDRGALSARIAAEGRLRRHNPGEWRAVQTRGFETRATRPCSRSWLAACRTWLA